MSIRRYELSDEEWDRLKHYFPERKGGNKLLEVLRSKDELLP